MPRALMALSAIVNIPFRVIIVYFMKRGLNCECESELFRKFELRWEPDLHTTAKFSKKS